MERQIFIVLKKKSLNRICYVCEHTEQTSQSSTNTTGVESLLIPSPPGSGPCWPLSQVAERTHIADGHKSASCVPSQFNASDAVTSSFAPHLLWRKPREAENLI